MHSSLHSHVTGKSTATSSLHGHVTGKSTATSSLHSHVTGKSTATSIIVLFHNNFLPFASSQDPTTIQQDQTKTIIKLYNNKLQ